jgi:ribonuclease P protein subunit RPR2
MRTRQKEEANDIAKERVDLLFSMAEKAAASGELETADRYVQMAWKIKLKFRVRLSSYQKRLFCRKCLKFLAGTTGRYRTIKGVLKIKCLNCGGTRRYPIPSGSSQAQKTSREKQISQAKPR